MFRPGAHDCAEVEVRLVLGKLGGLLGYAIGALVALQTAVSDVRHVKIEYPNRFRQNFLL